MYEHFQRIELPITIDEFHRLPRNAAYKYEYFEGRAVITPQPKSFACVRGTNPFTPSQPYTIEPLPSAEIPAIEDLFLGACRRTQPFESLSDDDARTCARDCLNRVVTGKDGPLVETACFRAYDEREPVRLPVGAVIITLVHEDILTIPFAAEWKDAPLDAVEKRFGCPHLTWIFVHPWMGRRGIASALLAAVVQRLSDMGYAHLASTFALDNPPSALWHWRNGFQLLPQMSAIDRLLAKRAERRASQ